MESSTIAVSATDGTSLHTYRWLPEGPPRAIVQIVHGVAEHAGRYARFAEALTAAGYAVYAEDHRGHGRTARDGELGHFGDHDGFNAIVGDLRTVTEFAQAEHPGVPVVLYGHSLGSFLARAYAVDHAQDLAGLILSATGGNPPPVALPALALSVAQARILGKRRPSGLLDKIYNNQVNSAFKPTRTAFDWLSRDEAEVDKYLADPLCGGVLSAVSYGDLVRGWRSVNRPEAFRAIPADLPVLVISGSRCQVGEDGKGPREVTQRLREAGVSDVTLTLYPDARHEILNETNRDEVTADVIAWLDEHLPTRD